MENDNMYNVNIYYSEEEVHEAFKNYYNEVKQHSKVHIFTNNALPLSLYGEENNVALYSTGSLWDKLKAWLAGEKPLQQQFTLLNISKEKSERYRSLIKNGGTIIISTQHKLNDDHTLQEFNEINDTTSVEGEVPPLPTTIPNDVILTESNNDNFRIDLTPETINQSFTQASEANELSELDAHLNNLTSTEVDLQSKFNEDQENGRTENPDDHDKTSEEMIDHSNEPTGLNNLTQPSSQEQNIYIANVSAFNQVPFADDKQIEYYEDGPRKHNLYSENLKKLSSDQEEIQNALENNIEPFDVSTNLESISRVLNETSNTPEYVTNNLNQEPSTIQQLDNIVQQAQQLNAFDNNQPQLNELLNLVQQLSPDEVMNIFNLISSNVPTDSTESVLDYNLLAKLSGYETDEVKNLFAFEQEIENEIIIPSDEQNDLSVDPSAEGFEADQLLNDVSTETEHNRQDSP